MSLKPVTNPKAFYNVVVLKDGSEISTFARSIHGSVMTLETFVDLNVPSSVKVLKQAARGKGKAAKVYRKMEVKVSDIAGVKASK